jgi:hypothetical protein
VIIGTLFWLLWISILTGSEYTTGGIIVFIYIIIQIKIINFSKFVGVKIDSIYIDDNPDMKISNKLVLFYLVLLTIVVIINLSLILFSEKLSRHDVEIMIYNGTKKYVDEHCKLKKVQPNLAFIYLLKNVSLYRVVVVLNIVVWSAIVFVISCYVCGGRDV